MPTPKQKLSVEEAVRTIVSELSTMGALPTEPDDAKMSAMQVYLRAYGLSTADLWLVMDQAKAFYLEKFKAGFIELMNRFTEDDDEARFEAYKAFEKELAAVSAKNSQIAFLVGHRLGVENG